MHRLLSLDNRSILHIYMYANSTLYYTFFFFEIEEPMEKAPGALQQYNLATPIFLTFPINESFQPIQQYTNLANEKY